MPGESYRRRLRSLLLYLCYVFRALINSLVCWFCTSALGLVLFQINCCCLRAGWPTLFLRPTRDAAQAKTNAVESVGGGGGGWGWVGGGLEI